MKVPLKQAKIGLPQQFDLCLITFNLPCIYQDLLLLEKNRSFLQNSSAQLIALLCSGYSSADIGMRKLDKMVTYYISFTMLDRIRGRSSRSSQMFFKIGVLKNLANLTGKLLCWTQLFSCEICEISENTLFYRTPRMAASLDN